MANPNKLLDRLFLYPLMLVLLTPLIGIAQHSAEQCTQLKSGVFHFYPLHTNEHYIIYFDGDKEREINTRTNDTTFWEVKWDGDCRFTQKFISSTGELDKKTEKFLKQHIMAYSIEKVTSEYFTFKGYIDKFSGTHIQSDTIWMGERIRQVIPTFIESLTVVEANRLHIKDTSAFALLYIYRPGKFTNSLSNYVIYLDDNALCIAANKSGHIFKISKPGIFEFKSKLGKSESAIKVDIKTGKKYFIKSMIHWGMYRGLSNYKLEMAEVPQTVGVAEFADVNVN